MTAEPPDGGSSSRAQLRILAVALVLAMAPWFSTAAVLGQLRQQWTLSAGAAAWLTIAVQLGFVAGAVLSAATNLADRITPRRLIFMGATGAALANASIVVFESYGLAVVARSITGACLALVYPPALKAMSSWFQKGRGFALGVMIGALTLGSALPHLLNALGGADWRPTLLVVSGLTFVGGLISEKLVRDGPHAVGPAVFDPSQLRAIVSNRDFRLASTGYFGHMWELYAMWAWITAFLGDVFVSDRAASLAGFAVIGAGAFGSVYAGLQSDRRSRMSAASQAMRWSAAASIFTGFLVDLPPMIVLAVALGWGFWVVADSAQFSAIVTECVKPAYVGTALTMQLAAGFVLTVFTIFLVPVVRDAWGWGFAFLMLAPGPIVGAIAMRALERDHTPA